MYFSTTSDALPSDPCIPQQRDFHYYYYYCFDVSVYYNIIMNDVLNYLSRFRILSMHMEMEYKQRNSNNTK